MSKSQSVRVRVALQPIFDRAFDQLKGQRRWTDGHYISLILEELESDAQFDLNEFRPEIVTKYVKEDVERRTRQDPFLLSDEGRFDPGLFDVGAAEQAVIRFGDGGRCTVAQANIFGLQARQRNQIRASRESAAAAEATAAVIDSEVGRMMVMNVELTLSEAIIRVRNTSSSNGV